MIYLKKIQLLIIAMVCAYSMTAQDQVNSYRIPEFRNDGIATCDIRKVYADTSIVFDVIGKMRDYRYGNIHSFLVLKDNKLVVEEYFGGTTVDSEQLIYSIAKSYASILIGLCIEKGYIQSDTDLVSRYLPEVRKLNLKNGTERIRISHLMSMSSGLNFGGEMWKNSDTTDHVCSIFKPQKNVVPGTGFEYSDMNAHIMAHLVSNVIPDSLEGFAKRYLFDPMQINGYIWQKCICHNVNEFSDCLYVKSRDLAKLGILMLNEGKWNGAQIINSSWLKLCTQTHQVTYQFRGDYGYYWFTNSLYQNGKNIPAFSSGGSRGQLLMVIPSYRLIIVLTGDIDNYRRIYFPLITEKLMPAFSAH